MSAKWHSERHHPRACSRLLRSWQRAARTPHPPAPLLHSPLLFVVCFGRGRRRLFPFGLVVGRLRPTVFGLCRAGRGGRSLAVLDAGVVNVYQGASAIIFMVDPYRPETLDKVGVCVCVSKGIAGKEEANEAGATSLDFATVVNLVVGHRLT